MHARGGVYAPIRAFVAPLGVLLGYIGNNALTERYEDFIFPSP